MKFGVTLLGAGLGLALSACGGEPESGTGQDAPPGERAAADDSDASGYYFCMMADFEGGSWYVSEIAPTELDRLEVMVQPGTADGFEEAARAAHEVGADANVPNCFYKTERAALVETFQRYETQTRSNGLSPVIVAFEAGE